MAVVTLSRQYGANGLQLARELAKRLGYRFVDREAMETIAQKKGMTRAEAHAILDGQRGTIFDLVERVSTAVLKGVNTTGESYQTGRDGAELLDKTEDMLLWLAEEDDLVITGCGGQKILKNLPNAVHVRVVASHEDRLANLMSRKNLSEASAADLMDRKEKAAKRFMQKRWDLDREDPALYDAVLNLTNLGRKSCMDMIRALIQTKVKKSKPRLVK